MKNTYYNDFKIKTEIGTIILKNDWSNRVKTACKINHIKEKEVCYVHYNCTANETIIQYRKEVK